MPELVIGIALDSLYFKETSLIARIFTKQYGLISVLVNGVRKKASTSGLAYFQPLTIIEFKLHHQKSALHRADNFHFQKQPFDISNVRKSAIAIFVSEMVARTTEESEVDEHLFNLIEHIAELLKSTDSGLNEIPLYFLYRYSSVLGFSLKHFRNFTDPSTVQGDFELQLERLEEWSEDAYHPLGFQRLERSILTKRILSYFAEHLGVFSIKSFTILEEVFSV